MELLFAGKYTNSKSIPFSGISEVNELSDFTGGDYSVG